jgi:hypothetical protein
MTRRRSGLWAGVAAVLLTVTAGLGHAQDLSRATALAAEAEPDASPEQPATLVLTVEADGLSAERLNQLALNHANLMRGRAAAERALRDPMAQQTRWLRRASRGPDADPAGALSSAVRTRVPRGTSLIEAELTLAGPDAAEATPLLLALGISYQQHVRDSRRQEHERRQARWLQEAARAGRQAAALAEELARLDAADGAEDREAAPLRLDHLRAAQLAAEVKMLEMRSRVEAALQQSPGADVAADRDAVEALRRLMAALDQRIGDTRQDVLRAREAQRRRDVLLAQHDQAQQRLMDAQARANAARRAGEGLADEPQLVLVQRPVLRRTPATPASRPADDGR